MAIFLIVLCVSILIYLIYEYRREKRIRLNEPRLMTETERAEELIRRLRDAWGGTAEDREKISRMYPSSVRYEASEMLHKHFMLQGRIICGKFPHGPMMEGLRSVLRATKRWIAP